MTSLARAHELYALADSQAGHFTAAQAMGLGYRYPTQHHHVRQGSWQRVGHGMFRLASYPITPHEHLARLSLWSRDRQGHAQAVVSHHTALAFHGLSDLLPDTVHLTVPPIFRKPPPPGVVLHRGEVTDEERQTEHGFQVTTVLRTLRNVGDSEFVEQAVQGAPEQGRISPAQRARLEQDCP